MEWLAVFCSWVLSGQLQAMALVALWLVLATVLTMLIDEKGSQVALGISYGISLVVAVVVLYATLAVAGEYNIAVFALITAIVYLVAIPWGILLGDPVIVIMSGLGTTLHVIAFVWMAVADIPALPFPGL